MARAGMESPDKRASARLPVETTVRYQSEGEITGGRGFDLSENGIGFQGGRLLPVGAAVEIEFRMTASHGEWFRVKGVVRRSTHHGMGVEFLGIGPAIRSEILKAIYHELAIRRRQA
jgi:hypothetical protein